MWDNTLTQQQFYLNVSLIVAMSRFNLTEVYMEITNQDQLAVQVSDNVICISRANRKTDSISEYAVSLVPKPTQKLLRSQPPARPLYRAIVISLADTKKHWQQLIGSAKAFWWKLPEEELRKTNGQEQKLIDLVSRHYLVNKSDAKIQVKRFFQQITN